MSWLRGVRVIVLLAATPACSGGETDSPALSGATALSVGFQSSCALINDGTVRCWGANYDGQLGIGLGETSKGSWTAVRVERVAEAIGIAVADRYACAALANGSVKCWGALPTWPAIRSPSPALSVDQVTGAQAVATGMEHACALEADGAVQCWGNGKLVNLGDGSLVNDSVPWSRVATVADLSRATTIAVNFPTSCALLVTGEIKCWGEIWVDGDTLDDERRAGRAWLRSTATPKPIEGLPPAVGLTLGDGFGCALLQDTTVTCWGALNEAMGGTGKPSVVPTPVADLSDAVAITAGDAHACALLGDRSIRCWGANVSGQLGDGTELGSAVPVRVQGIDNAIAIAAGGYRTCALLADRTVRCWGDNALGCSDSDGLCHNSTVPVVVRVTK